MSTPTLLKLTKRERAAIDSYLEDKAATALPPPPPSRASTKPAPQPNGAATRAYSGVAPCGTAAFTSAAVAKP